MSQTAISSLGIYWRSNNERAGHWDAKIRAFLAKKFPSVRVVSPSADDAIDAQVLLVLGGDGAILEAAKKYYRSRPVILGLNLGTVGFLAAIRDEKSFLAGLETLLNGKYWATERMMINISVARQKREVFASTALNEVFIQNPLGMVGIKVSIDGHPVQYIQGTGAMVATPNGSTGYNLSAHGPILMPDMECLIISEILDHNIPTPPIVINGSSEVEIEIADFRQREFLTLTKTKQTADVILSADNAEIFPLAKRDIITVKRSPHSIAFAEIERHYFLKSLREKFGYK